MTFELVFIYYWTVCNGDWSVDADRTNTCVMTSELVFIFYYRTLCYGDWSIDADRTNTSVKSPEVPELK